MFVQQFVDEGLGNSSFLVGSVESGVAAVIDPVRDAESYVREAHDRGVHITHTLETHLHADFVSGSRELAARTGATVCASAEAGLEYEHKAVREGDVIELGDLRFQVMATPGHTPEHVSYLALDRQGRPAALFSGGALIVGGAARTDLLGPDKAEGLAQQLFHTMHDKLADLPDELPVWPTHGAGSFCAAPASQERTTTIGTERRHNPLMQASSEAEFVKRALDGLSSYPEYFKRTAFINRQGPRVLGGIPPLAPLSAAEVKRLIDGGAMVVDSRPGPAYAAGHIPESFGVPMRSAFASWVGWFVPPDHPLIIVSAGRETHHDMARQLVGIGYDSLAGYLEGGVAAWAEAGFTVARMGVIGVDELKQSLASPVPPMVLDVRQDNEWQAGRIPGALHMEAGDTPSIGDGLPRDRNIAVHCGTHNRSVTALSVLERKGFKDLTLIRGGWEAWRKAGYDIEREKQT